MKKLVTVLLLITIFSCALVLVGCTVNKDKNGDQIGQSNTLTTDPIVGRYKHTLPPQGCELYLCVNKDGTAITYTIIDGSDGKPYLYETSRPDYWVYDKATETYEMYGLSIINNTKINITYHSLTEVNDGKIGQYYTRITDDEWPDCIPEE